MDNMSVAQPGQNFIKKLKKTCIFHLNILNSLKKVARSKNFLLIMKMLYTYIIFLYLTNVHFNYNILHTLSDIVTTERQTNETK